MPRTPVPPAMKDSLIAAVIAKLPQPGTPFPASEREAWFTMMRHATDVAYGPCERLPVTRAAQDAIANAALNMAPMIGVGDDFQVGVPRHSGSATVVMTTRNRFYVDHDGFAMCNGKPIDPQDLPAGSILWDERSGIDHGNPDSIMWKTGGSNKQRLPIGVQLRAAEARAVNGELTT